MSNPNELDGLYAAYHRIQEQMVEVELRAEARFETAKSEKLDDVRRYEFSAGMHHALMTFKHELQQMIAKRGGVVGELADEEDWGNH